MRAQLPRLLALTVFAALALAGCEAGYIMQQGVGQLAMLSRREPLPTALHDPRLPEVARDRLVVAWHARRYAERTLGLRTGESYRDVVVLDRDAVSSVVSAARPYSLDRYLWCFPIAGCLPYIGYFNRADADRETRRLRDLGYDVAMRGVSAYSLGGWMPDPIYSSLLDESRGWVANTVIHELTHGTVFLAGRAGFNESLATFIGDHGAIAFLREHYGAGSRTVRDAEGEIADYAMYEHALTDIRTRLVALYGSGRPRAEILRERMQVFAEARARIAALPLRTIDAARLSQRLLNNAVLATHATYFGNAELFDRVYQRLGRNLPRFVAFVRDEVAHQSDPEVWLRHWLGPELAANVARAD
jgi:predicted aminopeptidase